MRNRLFLVLAILCATLLIIGCNYDKPKYGSPLSVRLFGVTRRADFESGQKFGIYVGEPVNAQNVLFTFAPGGNALSDEEIRWAFDQSSASRFFAYTPYDASYTGHDDVVIDIPADQSTVEKLLSANIMTGLASGAPGSVAVPIYMKHAMTAMIVSFDNRTGSRIESMTVTGFMTQGKLNFLTGTLTAEGSKSRITPYRSPSGADDFCFLYVPQDGTPVFSVKLSSGKTINITFDNYCHEYPGQIIKMGRFILTESAQEYNILQLDGVSVTQWLTNGVPPMPESDKYISLAQLKNVIPNKDGFFSAYINKVTVTAVDRTNPDYLGVILEDSTCAIHAWTNIDAQLYKGNTIVGLIAGLMDKPSNEEYHISYFYPEYATIGRSKELPSTKGSFRTLRDSIGELEYRRMQFEGAILKEGFRNGRAVFMQDSTELSVVCRDIDVNLTVGVKGVLTGFPVMNGSDLTIMVYDPEQFSSFTKEDATDMALVGENVYGLYDLSDPDTCVAYMGVAAENLQFSVRHYPDGRSLQVTDEKEGECHFVYVYDCPDKPVVGHEYNVAVSVSGKSELSGTTSYMECVKCTDDCAWFVDRSGSKGLILAL